MCPCRETIRPVLQHNPVSHPQLRHIFAYFDNFTYYLVTGIRALMVRKRGRRNAKIAIRIDQVEIAAAYPRQAVPHAHPILNRQ